jgi:hypothetical protein
VVALAARLARQRATHIPRLSQQRIVMPGLIADDVARHGRMLAATKAAIAEANRATTARLTIG